MAFPVFDVIEAELLASIVLPPPPPVPPIVQVTNSTGPNSFSTPSLSGDGLHVAFSSFQNLTGQNVDGNSEIYLWTWASGFTQITNTLPTGSISDTNTCPSITSDGSRVAFVSGHDLVPGSPGNSDGTMEIFLWTKGVGITQITNATYSYPGSVGCPAITPDGKKIGFQSTADFTGDNPERNVEVFLWSESDGFRQITNTAGFVSPVLGPVAVNADGTRIAFVSRNNITGENPVNLDQLFIWDGIGVTQIPYTVLSGLGGAYSGGGVFVKCRRDENCLCFIRKFRR